MINWQTVSLENLAGFLSDELRNRGIDVILVGGACATIYSHSRYQSYDLDFVTYEDLKKVKQALKELGLEEKNGFFQHPKCKWMVEFVSPPAAIGKEIISEFQQLSVATGTIKMLRPEDSIKDRLASYFYWNDRQGLEQAIAIYVECKISIKEIKLWALHEGFEDKFQEFFNRIKT